MYQIMISNSLLGYLKDNSSALYDDSLQSKLLKDISSALKNIGIWNAEYVFEGVYFESDGPRTLRGYVDMAVVAGGDLYLIEAANVKKEGNSKKNAVLEMNHWLEGGYYYFMKYFGISAKCIRVYRYQGSSKLHAHENVRPVEDILIQSADQVSDE